MPPSPLHRPSRPSRGDYDGDGDADLATATGCYARIFRNDGGDRGAPVLTSGSAHEPLADCHLLVGPFYRGTRARWADLDRDGDLDAAFAGDPACCGAQTAASFTVAGDIVPPSGGPVSDFALVDGDDDGDLDASSASPRSTATRLYRRGGAGWTRDDWVGQTTQTLTVEPRPVRRRRPGFVFAVYGNKGLPLTGGPVGTSPFSPAPASGCRAARLRVRRSRR